MGYLNNFFHFEQICMNNMEEKMLSNIQSRKQTNFSSSDPFGLIMLHGFDITESTLTQTGKMRVNCLI